MRSLDLSCGLRVVLVPGPSGLPESRTSCPEPRVRRLPPQQATRVAQGLESPPRQDMRDSQKKPDRRIWCSPQETACASCSSSVVLGPKTSATAPFLDNAFRL